MTNFRTDHRTEALRLTDWDAEVDVAVVGAGGCGLAAALAAQDAGASVAIFEKLDHPGGNTALSTGSIPGAGTRFQAEHGIDDCADLLYKDLIQQSGEHDAIGLVRTLADTSAALVEWLVDEIGVNLLLITDYRHVGHSVPRLHAPPSRRGADLMADLLRAAQAREVPIAVGNPVSSIVVDDAGWPSGIMIAGDRRAAYCVRAKKVVLAANGFGANKMLVETYCPEVAGAQYFGSPGSTGEAIEWAEGLGARLGNMGAYQSYATLAYPHGSQLSWTTIEKGGFICNVAGRRFGDETVGYSGFAEQVLAQGGHAYAVFDSRIRDYVSAHEVEFRELCEMGGVRQAQSSNELSEIAGVPGDALGRTIAAYNDRAGGAGLDQYGRSDFGFAPLLPPYAITEVVPGLLHTQGGVIVDQSARAIRSDGSAIPNVFAGGGVAVGISGRSGPYGYSSGSGLLTALGLGRIAGRTAAVEIAQGEHSDAG